MKYVLSGVALPLDADQKAMEIKIAKECHCDPRHFSWRVLKKSVDARKGDVHFVYSFVIESDEVIYSRKLVFLKENPTLSIPSSSLKDRPVIVGFGPAGMYAALVLARAGAKPIVIERGKKVEERAVDVEALRNGGSFNPESNVCFGEGGAGTFSDGKLNTGVNDSRTKFILEEFVSHGASKNILFESLPHIGSDRLQKVVRAFREEIISLGGDILFNSLFDGLDISKGKVVGAFYTDESNKRIKIETNHVILAFGHSPYETVKKLVEEGLHVEPKDYSIGVRIEHLQKDIDRSLYHDFYMDPHLPRASYKNVSHLSSGRSLYTFCMCPGGYVFNSSSRPNTVLTNGMSNEARDATNGNSAILVNVKVSDYFSGNPLDGFLFREKIEKEAFCKDKPYFAPVESVGSFLGRKPLDFVGSVSPSYKPGVFFSPLRNYLPKFISSSLEEGLVAFGKNMSFFQQEEAIMTGFETRSSSPIRIPRNELFESNIGGLYPSGEGASYAGGITSAALDGIKVALAILNSK